MQVEEEVLAESQVLVSKSSSSQPSLVIVSRGAFERGAAGAGGTINTIN